MRILECLVTASMEEYHFGKIFTNKVSTSRKASGDGRLTSFMHVSKRRPENK